MSLDNAYVPRDDPHFIFSARSSYCIHTATPSPQKIRTQPILGTTRPDRLRACAEALRVELTREDLYELFATACGKAMP